MSALFLKYRPQTFTDLVGQSSVVKTLQNALKTDKPSHAYLFSGSRGTGKTSTARIFAKGLVCQNVKEGNPCGQCEFCKDISSGNLIDVIEIDAASNRGIDEIRELREKIQFSPNRAHRKVYIIDEVHMLTKEAFNALLKTLEEPPEHAFFLLATTEMHKLPETIISRCQTFIFSRFSLEQLSERLREIAKAENFSIDDEALELISRKAEGGLRDAISLLEQISAETENNITAPSVRESLGISSSEILENFWKAIQEKNLSAGLEILKEISISGKDFRTFGHDVLGFLQNKLHQYIEEPEMLATVLPAIEEIENALGRLKTSPIVNLPLEIAVFNLCYTAPQKIIKPIIKKQIAPPQAQEEKKIEDISEKTTPPAPTPIGVDLSPKETVSPPPSNKPEEHNSGFVFGDTPTPPTPTLTRQHQKIETSTETPSGENVHVSSDTILSKMKEIAEKAGIPSFAKKSFLTTKPECHEEKIIFYAESAFHLEKIKTESTRSAIQNAMIEIFGQKMMIDFLISNGQKEPSQKETVATVNDFLNF